MGTLIPIAVISILAAILLIVNMRELGRLASMSDRDRQIYDEERQRLIDEGW